MSDKKPPKRRLRNYLLDARYQLSFTLPMVLIVAAVFAGLGYVAMRKIDTATKIGITQLETTGEYVENASATREALLTRRRNINIGIVVIGVLLCLGLATFGVVLSHRVAGPMYRLRAELAKIRDGSLEPVAPLRSGDSLIEFYDRFREAHEALRSRELHEVEVLRRVIAAAEQGGSAKAEQLAGLRARLEAKEVSLG